MNTSNVKREPVDVLVDEKSLSVLFSDGTRVSLPVSYSTRLQSASSEQRSHWQWIGRRTGIHWPDVDEDLSVSGIVRDAAASTNLAEVA